MQKIFCFGLNAASCLILSTVAAAANTLPASAQHRWQNIPPEATSAAGVTLRVLIGRDGASPDVRSKLASIALFHLDAGSGSAWSHNRVGEESFFFLSGHGTLWTDGHQQMVGPGSYVLVRPSTVRSVRADSGEPLDYYAVTAPAWSKKDDVLVAAPAASARH